MALVATGQSLNMYFMIGLLLLMQITKKNLILLMEFMNKIRERDLGKSVNQALMEACSLRLRPILMTSAATIAAVVPRAIVFGEGS